MNICIIDFETTGVDTTFLSVTEFGVIYYNTDENKILKIEDFMIEKSVDGEYISDEASKLTGITNEDIEKYGYSVNEMLTQLCTDAHKFDIKYYVAHNGSGFDRVIFERYFKNFAQKDITAFMLEIPWLDTIKDVPYPIRTTSRRLTHLCADHGYLIANAHRAIFDCLGLLEIVKHYTIEKIIEYSKLTDIELIAINVTPPWLDNYTAVNLCKLHNFKFNATTKQWYRIIKENELGSFKFPFKTERREVLNGTKGHDAN